MYLINVALNLCGSQIRRRRQIKSSSDGFLSTLPARELDQIKGTEDYYYY